LSFEELEAWRNLPRNTRQRRQWLLGRICLKEAVREWVQAATGERLFPSDIVVLHDEHGAPQVDGWWCDTLIAAPSVSLSHNDSTCLAAATESARAVGVDLEDIGRVRKPELLMDSLTAAERQWLVAQPQALRNAALIEIWCAKEAAAKWTGLGLQGDPSAFEVAFVNISSGLAVVAWSGNHIQVMLTRDNQAVIALATGLYSSTREVQ
jgi:phosphopantetheinyl transferase